MLATAIQDYIGYHAAADWSRQTVYQRRWGLRLFLAFIEVMGHRRWSSVIGSDCDAFMLDLADRGLARVSRDSVAWSVRGFGQWLLAQGLTLRDPAADLVVLADDEFDLPPAPLSEQQVTTLFERVPRASVIDLRNRLHLELLYSCGLRNVEAVSLDLGDLDVDERVLFVRTGKGGTPRALPMMAGTINAASEYLALRRELLRGPDRGPLLLSPRGQRLGLGYMQRLLAKASPSLGFRVYPHLLRHSIAVHLLRQGADVRHIQRFLGHASLETTKIYLRLVPGHLRADYDAAMPTFPIEPAPAGTVGL